MLFSAFWVGMGAYAVAETAWALAYLAGYESMALALFVLHVKTVGTIAGFAGLVSYLLTIHDVDRRLRGVVFGVYALVLAATSTFYAWRDPVGQVAHTWGMRLVYARNDVEPWWSLLLLVLLLPPFLAALSYATLLRHTVERELRYRISLTATSLMLFFAPLFLGWRAGDWAWWGAVEKGLAVAMTVGMVLALWPTPAIREWLRGERAPAPDDALLRRAHDLV